MEVGSQVPVKIGLVRALEMDLEQAVDLAILEYIIYKLESFMKRIVLIACMFLITSLMHAQQWLGSSNITGTGNSEPVSILTDDLQNTYVGGYYTGTIEYPYGGTMVNKATSTPSVVQNRDIFLIKYNDDEEMLWFKTIGGDGYDGGTKIAFSNDENILVSGMYSTTCYFGQYGNADSVLVTDQSALVGATDVFLAKYSDNGSLLWYKKVVWGDKAEFVNSIDVDGSGNILISGYTQSSIAYFTNDVTITKPTTSNRIGFVVKFDQQGNYLWHMELDQPTNGTVTGTGTINSIASDNSNYYIAGYAKNPNTKITDAQGVDTYINNTTGKEFFYLITLDIAGNLVDLQSSIGNSDDRAITVKKDDNDIYLAGTYKSSSLSFGRETGAKTSVDLTNKGSDDIFIMKLNADGAYIGSRSISTTGKEELYNINIHNNIMYIAGLVGGPIQFNNDYIDKASMFIAASDLDQGPIGAVPGLAGTGRDMVYSPKSFKLAGIFSTASLELEGLITYINPNPGTTDMFLAKGCPIIAINDLEIKNVSGCDPLAKNGMISLDVVGSAGPYTYQWEKEGVGVLANQTSSTANNLDTGKYVVTVLYNDGFCSKEREFTITAPNAIAVSEITVTNADCDNPAIKGSFQVQVYNPAGQELQYKAIGYNYNESGLVEVYNKDWSSNGGSFTDCPAGRYIVSVRVGDDGCETNSQTIVAEKSSTGDLVGTIIKDYQCSIQNWPELVGEVSVEVTNTSTQQDWFALVDASTGATVQTTTAGRGRLEGQKCTFSEVAPGTYGFKAGIIGSSCLLVSDNNLTMTVKPAIIVRSVKPQDVLCSGKPTGKITVSASGGVGTLSYKLLDKDDNDTNNTTGSASGVFTGLSGGVYSVVAIDADLCTDTVPGIEIKDLNPELLLALDETYDACSGQSNAKIVLKASGGLTNGALYTYTLSKNGGSVQNTTGTFSGLSAANDYKAVVMEQTTKCKTELANPIDVGQLQPITIGTHNATSVLCKGDNTGTITVSNITGGTNSGYTVSLLEKPGQTPNVDEGNYVFTGLSVGTYTIQITDDYGCASYDVAQSVGEPLLPLTVSATPAPADCYGYSTGSITAVGAGGTSSGTNPYKYELYHQGNLLVGSQESGVFIDLPAGTAYVVKVTDANSCTADSDTKEITQPTAMTITTQTYDIDCYGNTNGSIVVNATGGIGTKTYELCDKDGKPLHDNGTSPSFIGLAAGDYIVKVYLDNNCSQSTPVVTINQPAAALVMNSQVRNISCGASTDNGSITISATGGTAPYTYSLGSENSGAQTGEYTFSDLSAGTYTIGLVDSKGCAVVSETKEIAQAAAMKVEAVATEATCFGYKDGVITAVPERQESGLLYCLLLNGSQKSNWQSDPEFSNAKTAGLLEVNTPYAIRMKDSYDCVSESEVVEIIQPSAIVVSIESTGVSNTSSNDGTIKVTASGGVVSGQYQFQLTNESSTPIYEFEKHENPYTYAGLAIGKYSAQVKDDNGCVQTSTEITISVKTGVDDIVANSLKIYPNPSDGRFILQWESKKNMQVTVEIFNTSGKLVYKNKVSIGTGGVQTNVDISNQAKGTYILRVPELEINEKLVVQ